MKEGTKKTRHHQYLDISEQFGINIQNETKFKYITNLRGQ